MHLGFLNTTVLLVFGNFWFCSGIDSAEVFSGSFGVSESRGQHRKEDSSMCPAINSSRKRCRMSRGTGKSLLPMTSTQGQKQTQSCGRHKVPGLPMTWRPDCGLTSQEWAHTLRVHSAKAATLSRIATGKPGWVRLCAFQETPSLTDGVSFEHFWVPRKFCWVPVLWRGAPCIHQFWDVAIPVSSTGGQGGCHHNDLEVTP